MFKPNLSKKANPSSNKQKNNIQISPRKSSVQDPDEFSPHLPQKKFYVKENFATNSRGSIALDESHKKKSNLYPYKSLNLSSKLNSRKYVFYFLSINQK